MGAAGQLPTFPAPLMSRSLRTTIFLGLLAIVVSSGAGVAVDDLDNDGDLDIIVNNLLAPAIIYENQLCAGPSLEVDLRWPDSANSGGVGARLTLHTSVGSLTREVRVNDGYASGAPARIHFGFPPDASLTRLDILWPDGATSSIPSPPPSTLLAITRD